MSISGTFKSGSGRVSANAPRQVALIVETAMVSGREILKGIGRFLREGHGWTVVHEPRNLLDPAPRWLEGWKGHGIIARVASAEMAEVLRRTRLPVVDVLGLLRDTNFPLVHVDDAAIARMAARHLGGLGLSSFGFYGFVGENWSEQRRDAFCAEMEMRGAPPRVLEVERRLRLSPKQGRRLREWLRRLPKPTGVLVCNDDLANDLLQCCRQSDMEVPEQVAVLGVDDDDALCSIACPPLSSIRAAHAEVGYQAALLLQRWMRGGVPPKTPVWISPGEVLTRQSTDVMAVADPRLQQALRCIQERGCGKLSVDEIARAAGLSRSVLQRRFRARLGKTVHAAIRRHQVETACRLLADTELPMAEVAAASGFPHAEYFSHVFREEMEMTPRRYRLAMRREARSEMRAGSDQ
ncbi:MAG: DNA-binding transcriptional regulator [Verrucomicrobiales bacterium]|nr:DNA-binding transcriptional regulator [Verrucomicrobiales bacterium]